MKKIVIFTLLILNSLNAKSQQTIPSIPIIRIETNAAIIQKSAKPFKLSPEYYQIFKVLNIKNTIQVNDLFIENIEIPKQNIFYPLFKPTVLLKLARQIMLSNEQDDIDCAKAKLAEFANLFVGDTNSRGIFIPCEATKSSELAAQVAVLNSIYSKFYNYSPIEDSYSLTGTIPCSNKKTDNISCIGSHDFRTDMNFNLLNSKLGGNGENTKFTLIENGYINLTDLRTIFSNTRNPKLHDSTFFKNIALEPTGRYSHAQQDISILFDNPSLGLGIKGVCQNVDIKKIYFFKNNCMLNLIYAEFETLLDAIVETPRNGVLLLEFGAGSNNTYPAEKDPILFELIKFATKYKNIIVIEPAGNLGCDIATMTYTPKYIPLSRICNPVNYNDSGAIIVGGAEANPTTDITGIYRGVANSYCGTSNYGNRIDCFAQGEFVNTNYGNHSSTSSASAIIAGLVIDIQSIAQARYGSFLNPVQMRYLLSRPSSIRVKQFGFLNDKYIPVITESLLLELDRFFLNCPPNCPLEK